MQQCTFISFNKFQHLYLAHQIQQPISYNHVRIFTTFLTNYFLTLSFTSQCFFSWTFEMTKTSKLNLTWMAFSRPYLNKWCQQYDMSHFSKENRLVWDWEDNDRLNFFFFHLIFLYNMCTNNFLDKMCMWPCQICSVLRAFLRISLEIALSYIIEWNRRQKHKILHILNSWRSFTARV